MNENVCNDNRFNLIAKYKAKLIEATNIETSQDEMAVIDNILFRMWQMGWLDKLDAASPWHRVEEPPKWVSVFDDLPRNNAVVVVSDGKRSWDVGQYHFLFKADDRTIWWWKKHTTRKVLWWMYKEDAIPEPPKEDA